MTRGAPSIVRLVLFAVACALASVEEARAHAGPPFPIVSDRIAGPYRISIWTDPDATDDGSAGGQFWVIVEPGGEGQRLPPDTRVTVSIVSRDRSGEPLSGAAAPESADATRHFVALLMDHEGRYGVQATVSGPLGEAVVDAEVDATYDLRPPPLTIAVYVLPFLLVGGLWLKLLLRRRGEHRVGPDTMSSPDDPP